MTPYIDTIFVTLRKTVDPVVDGVLIVERMVSLCDHLTTIAAGSLYENYPYSTLTSVEWEFLYTPEDARALRLPHVCNDCLDGKNKAIDLLTHNVTVFVTVGTMHCEEPSA